MKALLTAIAVWLALPAFFSRAEERVPVPMNEKRIRALSREIHEAQSDHRWQASYQLRLQLFGALSPQEQERWLLGLARQALLLQEDLDAIRKLQAFEGVYRFSGSYRFTDQGGSAGGLAAKKWGLEEEFEREVVGFLEFVEAQVRTMVRANKRELHGSIFLTNLAPLTTVLGASALHSPEVLVAGAVAFVAGLVNTRVQNRKADPLGVSKEARKFLALASELEGRGEMRLRQAPGFGKFKILLEEEMAALENCTAVLKSNSPLKRKLSFSRGSPSPKSGLRIYA